MNSSRLLLFASAALLPAFPALAQDEDDAIVVVASGVEQPADEAGRSITLIGRDEIERRQTIALSDLLATTPGATVSRNGGYGSVTTVRIRGAEGEQTLVLIDGVRVNDPSSPGGAYDFGNLLAGSIERVEVLRGPNSVTWGSQAIGGVINIVTERAESGFAVRGAAEYGANETVSANAAISGRGEVFSGALTAGYFDTAGISTAASGTERDGYRQYGASGRVGVAFAPGFALDLRGYYADSRTDYDADFPAPAYVVADSSDYSTAEELYGYAGVTAELLGGKWKNRAAFAIADIARDNFTAPNTSVAFFARGRSERYEYQGDMDFGAVRAVFGAEHEDSRFHDGGPAQRQGVTGVYGEAIVTPVEQVTLTAGLRNDDHSGFGSHTSFGASAAVRPAEGTVLRASYGEGFKAPTLYQRFSAIGTPGLQPESAESWEIGAEQRLFGGRLGLGATWFHRDVKNQIDFDLGTFTYANIARARGRGFELELNARPAAGLTLQGSYTHVVAENRSPGANLGNDLARRPRDTASLSADYRFAFDLSLGATLLVAGKSFDDAGNFNRLDGYALVGIRAEMPVTDGIVVYGRVDNLFDERYQTVANYGTLGRGAHAGVRLRLD